MLEWSRVSRARLGHQLGDHQNSGENIVAYCRVFVIFGLDYSSEGLHGSIEGWGRAG